jgi:hypothetical protein
MRRLSASVATALVEVNCGAKYHGFVTMCVESFKFTSLTADQQAQKEDGSVAVAS